MSLSELFSLRYRARVGSGELFAADLHLHDRRALEEKAKALNFTERPWPRIEEGKFPGETGQARDARGDGRAARVAAPGKLYRARSRLHRSQILQENTHSIDLKALVEIYTMHSFAQLQNHIFSKN